MTASEAERAPAASPTLARFFSDTEDAIFQEERLTRHGYSLADGKVELASPDAGLLERLVIPFSHLPSTSERPDLRILVSPSSTHRWPFPLPPYVPRGELLSEGEVQASLQPASGTLTLFNSESCLGIVLLPDPDAMPAWEMASPFRDIFHWWLSLRGLTLAHGAAVALQGQCVLIAGGSGSGKSSTALSALSFGLDCLADDHLAVSGHASPKAWSLYSTAKLSSEALDRLPQLKHGVSHSAEDEEKVILALHRLAPNKLAESAAIAALVIPSIGDSVQSRVRPASPAEALQCLAPSSILQLPWAGEKELAVLGRLSRQVPAFGLELGKDPAGVAHALRGILEGRVG